MLKDRINETRKKLETALLEEGKTNSRKVQKLSQVLDKLILKYHKSGDKSTV